MFNMNIFSQNNRDTLINELSYLHINKIQIVGNNKTKSYIILRELFFKMGDSIIQNKFQIEQLILASKNQLINTTLFIDVKIDYTIYENKWIEFSIHLIERWYLFPLPYLKYIDRNFSQWFINNKADLSRLNYGVKLYYNNFTGRNDKLNIWLITGYADIIAFKYQIPFFDKSLKKGLSIGYRYQTQNEVNYNTVQNKQLFYTNNSKILFNNNANFNIQFRKSIKETHNVGIEYNSPLITDSLYLKNKNYFPDSAKSYAYFNLYYNYQYQHIDYIPFPTNGVFTSFNGGVKLSSTSENYATFSIHTTFAKKINQKLFFKTIFNGVFKTSNTLSYFNQQLIGYNNMLLRGLEYYVIDGYAGFVSNNSFYCKLLKIKIPAIIHKKSMSNIPFQMYVHSILDIGYGFSKTNNLNNNLNNQLLKTIGVGMDIVGIYDAVLKIDYSYNQLKESGIYINFSIGF